MAGKRERQAVAAFDEIISGPDTNSDVLGSVLASDRKRAGRGQQEPAATSTAPSPATPPAPPLVPNAEAQPVQQEESVLTSQPASQLTSIQSSRQDDAGTDRVDEAEVRVLDPELAPTLPRAKPSTRKSAATVSDPVRERVRDATRRAKSTTVTVSLRMPQELNVWLDAYVHESWPQRVKKQDLIIEALRMLIARRGKAGESIVSTELLPEEEG